MNIVFGFALVGAIIAFIVSILEFDIGESLKFAAGFFVGLLLLGIGASLIAGELILF